MGDGGVGDHFHIFFRGFVHFCITKPLQANIFALTKHVHRFLNPLTKTEMTNDNLQESSMVG
jgi:hypothetical protein